MDVVWSHFVSSLAATCGVRDERPVPQGGEMWDMNRWEWEWEWDGKDKESRSNEDHRICTERKKQMMPECFDWRARPLYAIDTQSDKFK